MSSVAGLSPQNNDLDPVDALLSELMLENRLYLDSECDASDIESTTCEDESWCPSEKYLRFTGSQLSQLYHLKKVLLDAKPKSALLSTVSDLLFVVYKTQSNWAPFEEIISIAETNNIVKVEGNDENATISLVSDEDVEESAVGKCVDESGSLTDGASSVEKSIEEQVESAQDDLSTHSEPSQLLLEYIETSPAITLRALCDSGGMCDALFANLNTEFIISPGAWWGCYSDLACGSRSMMSDAIIKMLDDKTARKWRTRSSPKIQEYPQDKDWGEENFPMHPIINRDLLCFWSELRRHLWGLYSTHYRSLQAQCSRGGTWIPEFEAYTTLLKIPPSHWRIATHLEKDAN